MSALLENIVAIVTVLGFVVTVLGFVGCIYKLNADLRKEMREDIGKCNNSITECNNRINKLSGLMMMYIFDPVAAKKMVAASYQEEMADIVKNAAYDLKPPKE